MKILLIAPKLNRKIPVSYHLPLVLAYLASSLEAIGVEVKFLDLEIDPQGDKRLEENLKHWRPDYVGISIHALAIESSLTLAVNIRRKINDVTLIAGGIHPSVFPETFLDKGIFDLVIRGDGEIPLTRLLSGEEPAKIPGICFLDNKTGRMVNNGTNYDPQNLDDLPFPNYKKIPIPLYPVPFGSFFKQPSYPIMGSRGCEASCTFCTSYQYNKKYRFRSPENIIEEIRRGIKEYGAQEVRFLDASFTYNLEHTDQLCEKFITEKTKFIWHCSTRVDKVDIGLLNKMKEAGCVGIGFGIESEDETLLKNVKKFFSMEQAVHVLNHCNQLGLFTKLSFMYALPGETKETLKRTLKMALRVPADLVIFNIMDIFSMLSYPTGTPIEDTYLKLKNEAEKKRLLPQVDLKSILSFRRYSFLRFYLRPTLIWRYVCRKMNWIFVLNNLINLMSRALKKFKIPI